MITEKIISVLETTRLMFELSLDDSDCDEDSAEAREDNEETVEAINEAIKALKREPCTDAVSREAVMKSLCELGYGDEENGAEAEYMSALWDTADKVKALPPVTPEKTTITYKDCSEAMLKMWIDNVLTDGQYNKIMDKLNAKHIADMRGASK